MKKKILFIGTGGTIASVASEDGLQPGFLAEELLDFFPEAVEMADITAMQLCSFDSTNLHPDHWKQMAQAVLKNYHTYDGFVIGHGTDTISYSASALSFALQGLSKPVVFTGSVLPLGAPKSDAKQNFTDSVRVASSDLVQEVCVCFHQEIIHGTRARKITNEATKITNEKMGVYASINLHLAGTIDVGRVVGKKIHFTEKPKQKNSVLECLDQFDKSVGLIKLFPGLEATILKKFSDKKAIIIEAFGPGNIPFAYGDWLPQIEALTQKEVLVVVTTQNPFGEVDMEKYEVGQKALSVGAIPAHDMITETALVKCMWILGNYSESSFAEKKALFLKNVCGEILNESVL